MSTLTQSGTIAQEPEIRYVCPKCHSQFHSLGAIERHFRNKVPCDYVCGNCDQPQHSKRSYYRHIKICH